MVVLRDRIGQGRSCTSLKWKTTFADVPSVVGAVGEAINFLDGVLTDVGDVAIARYNIPSEALGIAQAIAVDFGKGPGIPISSEGVVRDNSVLSVRAVWYPNGSIRRMAPNGLDGSSPFSWGSPPAPPSPMAM
jgi:hypothetical protein